MSLPAAHERPACAGVLRVRANGMQPVQELQLFGAEVIPLGGLQEALLPPSLWLSAATYAPNWQHLEPALLA